MTTANAPSIALAAGSGRDATAIGESYFKFLCICLGGYALMGKAFAYTGIAPIFVGEIALVCGVVVLMRSPGWSRLLHVRAVWPLLALMAWCTLRTLPFISEYGFYALRDATVFAYGVFALCVCCLLQANPKRLALALRRYAKFIPVFLGLIPFMAVLHRWLMPPPGLPWAPDVKLISMKESDIMVHLGGILAFWIIGFAGEVSWKWLFSMLFCVGITGVVDRSGLLAYLFVAAIATAVRPRSIVPRRLLALVVAGLLVLWITNVRLEIPGGKGREISADQFISNVTSIAGSSGSDSLDSTKEWRVDWWNEIISYTIHGKYRWTGKGFGINLADDDGFRLDEDGTLRSPHCVHMTFLARSGVTGLLLWIITQAAWAVGIVNGYFRAWRQKDLRWQGVFLFLGCYWGALLINGSFDVFLEGPMGGIWFWCVYGAGMGAMWLHEHQPESLLNGWDGAVA